jgi:hypothetical protein
MYKTAATVALVGMFVVPLGAQGRGRANSQGIPPGHLPPAGQCRVWYNGVPPGRQPSATSCREAERIAARDRNARVIYGANTDRRTDGWWDPREDRTGRAIPRPNPNSYPDRYPSRRYPNTRGTYRYANVAFDNGYNDGLDKGREDVDDRDSYDPNRHSRYRSADRGYEGRYGSKDQYRDIYREGFLAGYNDAYRGYDVYDRRSDRGRAGLGFPWPF